MALRPPNGLRIQRARLPTTFFLCEEAMTQKEVCHMDTGIYAFYKLVYCIRHGGSNDILELDQVLWLLAKQSAKGYLLTPECCFAWKKYW